MELPKFYQTFIPILTVLEGAQAVLSKKEIQTTVKNTFYSQLPSDLLAEKLSTGVNRLIDRVGWGLSYLVLGGYVHRPSRGQYRITAKGKEAVKNGSLTLAELKEQPEFLHRDKKRVNNKIHHAYKTSELTEESTPDELFDEARGIIERDVQGKLLEKLKNIDPFDFEKLILHLLKCMGYGETISTPKSNDGGVDGIINEDTLGLEKIYIQAKRFGESKVREKDIRNFIGAMSGDTNKGIFVTTSDFDEKAKDKAKSAHHKIRLINSEELVKLMYDYGVGVQVKNTIEVKEFDSDFFDE